MKRAKVLAVLLVAFCASVGAETLESGAELTLSPPWKAAVDLSSLAEGRYRLEATTLSGDPLEVVLERRNGADWVASASNRTLRGTLDASVDFVAAAKELWRVRPSRAETVTVILRLRKLAFGELKETLKQELTAGTDVTSALRKRGELPVGTGGPSLVAASAGTHLWVGWLTDGGWGAQVWDASTGRPWGRPLQAPSPWEMLSLSAQPTLVATLKGPQGAEGRAWSGTDWTDEAATSTDVTTPWGTLRTATHPVRVYRSTPSGWQDLGLPRDDNADLVLLGSTDDGLAVFLASSDDAHRAFYRWNPTRGWQALPAPPASGPPWDDLWATTSGAGSLYLLEGDATSLTLTQFDGTEWRPSLDLKALAPQGARAAALLGPSAWSRTGSLLIATDRVTVYDLP